MADFNDLLKKKTIKTENTKDSSDMKQRMRNVVNASKKLSDGDENTISNQKQDDLKARLAKAMEASKQVEEMYAEEFDKDAEAKKAAEKEERKKKLEEQQKKALEKLAEIEKADNEDNITKIEEPKVKKDLSELTKKENVTEEEKQIVGEEPKVIIQEVIKEVPVEVIKYVNVEKTENETLDNAFESGEEEIVEVEEGTIDSSIETASEELEKIEEEVKEPVKEKKPNIVLEFFTKTMNGMAYGLFATLIIGTILDTIAGIKYVQNIDYIYQFLTALSSVLKYSMGIGIGIGVAYNMGFKDIKLISLGLAGGIASYMCGNSLVFFDFEACDFKVGDPLSIYITLAITALLVKYVFAKKTSVDIIIVPLFAGIIAGLISFASSPAIVFVTTAIGNYIEIATQYHPLLMGVVIAVIMGMALTAPISSAAIASVVLKSAPLAGGAAVVGCCVQMLGFAVQTARDNKAGAVISVGIGTSMLQFKNIIKKPVIWLPTIIASAILGPIATCLLKTQCSGVSAGMGTSGLVGIIGTIKDMGMSNEMIISVVVLEFVAPIVLVFLIDWLFRALKIIKKGDLKL